MLHKSVTIRDDQYQYLENSHLAFSSWAREKIKQWREEGREFPSERSNRSGPMSRKSIVIDEELDEFLWEKRANLSHSSKTALMSGWSANAASTNWGTTNERVRHR
jgi:hypothetical protein